MRVRIWLALAAVACGLLTRPSAARAVTPSLTSFVVAQNEFAIALYWQLTRDQDRFVFSPFSISSVFAMALEGARGKTADEIERIVSIPRERGVRRSSYAALQPAAGLVNAVWMQKDGSFRKPYVAALKQHYGAVATDVDFPGGIWFVKRAVDTWIGASTAGRIRVDGDRPRVTRLEGPPDGLARDHLPGTWAAPSGMADLGLHPSLAVYASRTNILISFIDTATVAEANNALAAAGVEILGALPSLGMVLAGAADDGTFGPLTAALERLRKDPAVQVAALSPVMDNPEGGRPIQEMFGRMVLASAASASATFTKEDHLLYRGYADIRTHTSEDGALIVRVLFPRTGTFAEVERELTARNLAEWQGLGSNSSNRPTPETPAFSVRTRSLPLEVLQRMGMAHVFSESDFQGIDDGKTPLMPVLAHQATFSMTPQGFEAAAATAAGSPVVEVDPDISGTTTHQPLVFVVQDAKTGLILFMGRAR